MNQAIALISSPLQLLNAREWGEKFRYKISVVLLVDYLDERSLQQVSLLLRLWDWEHKSILGFPRQGLAFSIDGIRSLICYRKVLSHLESVIDSYFCTLLIGDLRLPICRHSIQYTIKKNYGKVWILDDGSASHQIARFRLNPTCSDQVFFNKSKKLPSMVRHWIGGIRIRLPANLNFFSIYDLELPCSDKLVKNNMSYLRSLQVTCNGQNWLIGSNNVEIGLAEEIAYLNIIEKLVLQENIQYYYSHRRESEKKLKRIESFGIEIIRPDIPLEYHCAINGLLPSSIYAIASTVFDTFNAIWGDRVEYINVDVGNGYAKASYMQHFNDIVADNKKVASRSISIICES